MPDELTPEEIREMEELETERERLGKEEQPRLPQHELEAELIFENTERYREEAVELQPEAHPELDEPTDEPQEEPDP